jgi:hypothetical protein
MATWEDTTSEQQVARGAPHWSLLMGLAAVLMLTAGTLAATRLPALRQARDRGPLEAARTAALLPLPPAPQYVVVFGTFGSRLAADEAARLVRRKGYIADVRRAGEAFHVVSRPYASADRARFWTAIFEQLGLDTAAPADISDLGS